MYTVELVKGERKLTPIPWSSKKSLILLLILLIKFPDMLKLTKIRVLSKFQTPNQKKKKKIVRTIEIGMFFPKRSSNLQIQKHIFFIWGKY